MPRPVSSSWWSLGLLVGTLLLLVGVAMSRHHDPVGLPPDAPPSGAPQVATFALG